MSFDPSFRIRNRVTAGLTRIERVRGKPPQSSERLEGVVGERITEGVRKLSHRSQPWL